MRLHIAILTATAYLFMSPALQGQDIVDEAGMPETEWTPIASSEEVGGPDYHAGELMTPELCRSLALENNKATSIARQNKLKSEATVKAYKANYLPKFSITGNYLYTQSDFEAKLEGNYLPTYVPDPATGELVPNVLVGPGGTPVIGPDGNPIFQQYAYFPDIKLLFDLKNTWVAGLTAEQPIYMGGKISSAYSMARIGNKVAELNMELTRAEVIVKADEAYWTCIKTRELVKLAQSYRDLIESLLRDVENARDVGLRHQNDVLKVQVKLNEAELQLRRAQNGLKLAMMNLCFVTGLPLDADVKLPESLEDAIAGELDIKRDYTGRPEYAMLEQQILLKEQEIKLTRSDFLPQVGLAANYGYINGLEMNGTKLLDATSFSALVSVNIPVFHWGEGRNKIKAAEAEKEIAKLQRENLGQMMELELAQAINKLDESLLEAEFTEKALKEAEENLRVSENRYKTGMQTLSEFMEAQSMWQNAYSQYIDALSRLQLNHTYYLKASGKL